MCLLKIFTQLNVTLSEWLFYLTAFATIIDLTLKSALFLTQRDGIFSQIVQIAHLKSTCVYLKFNFKGNKISKRPPNLSSSSSWCQKRQQIITPRLNLYSNFEFRVIFCCSFWHRLEDELEIGGPLEIFLPLLRCYFWRKHQAFIC